MSRGRRPKPNRPPPNLAPFDRFTFRLSWPPSANMLWRAVARARAVKSREARLYVETVGKEILEQRVPCNWLGSPLSIHVLQHAKSARGDVSNSLKAVEDALKHFGVIWDDNRRIVRMITGEDGDRSKVGWVQVTVAPYPLPTETKTS